MNVYLDDSTFADASYAVHTKTFTVEVIDDPCESSVFGEIQISPD